MIQAEQIEITEDDPDSDIDVIDYQKDQFPLTRILWAIIYDS